MGLNINWILTYSDLNAYFVERLMYNDMSNFAMS